jgi:serine/threonine-protein kinase RsbW
MSKLDLVIDSCLENVDLVRSCIGLLSSQIFDDWHCYQIKTCVVEAVTNCIKHSYSGVTGRTVKVSYHMDGVKIVIDVSDTGVAMDPQVFKNISPTFEVDPMNLDNLSEGGRGLKIIKAWTDDANYYSEDGVNHFTLVKFAHPKSGAISSGLD